MNEYSNTYYRTIKIKSVDVKGKAYFNFGQKVNDKDPKFQVKKNYIEIYSTFNEGKSVVPERLFKDSVWCQMMIFKYSL